MKTVISLVLFIVVVILFILLMRWVNCRADNCIQPQCITTPCPPICKPCSFWTGKPIVPKITLAEGEACSTTADTNKDGIIKDKTCVPAHLDSNKLLGKKIKITDAAGTSVGELDTNGCLIEKKPVIYIQTGTEIDILEAKIVPVNSCGNSSIIKLVRTVDGWFNINSVQII